MVVISRTFFCLRLVCTWIQSLFATEDTKGDGISVCRAGETETAVLQILLPSPWLCGKVFKAGFRTAVGFWRVC